MARRNHARSPRMGGPKRRDDPQSAVRKNRQFWEKGSEEYERKHRHVLGGTRAKSWGLWRVLERELQILGEVRNQDVLELGCGAARWSLALEAEGARVVGFDLSRAHLDHARKERARLRSHLPLVQGSADRLPFGGARFDVVFCDWGAMTFCDPYRTVPECARVLRPGGRLVFSTASPVRHLTYDPRSDRQTRTLRHDYFGQHRLEFPDTVDYQLTYGAWVQLFVENGFSIERLHETRPAPGARTPYLSSNDNAWGRRWPLECIWRVRKGAGPHVPKRAHVRKWAR
ncbi:MAG: methyltransferase domain-containing protein [Thermoplasmata archaeon]|nr:methyltransferase domain-containing protein [Thermoplasmata archaeon]